MVKTVSREKKMGVCPFIKLRPKTLIGCGPLLCPWHVTEVRITPPREKNGTGRMGLADMDCKETAFKTDAEHGNRSPQEVGKSKASFLNIGNVPKLGILLKFLIYSVCVNKRHRYRRTHRTQDKRDSRLCGAKLQSSHPNSD